MRLRLAGGSLVVLIAAAGCGEASAPPVARNVETKPPARILPPPTRTPDTGPRQKPKPNKGRPDRGNQPPRKPSKPRGQLYSCGGTPFSLSALDAPTGAERADDPAARALRQALPDRELDLTPRPWRLIVRKRKHAEFLGGEPPLYQYATFDVQYGRWGHTSSDNCRPFPVIPHATTVGWALAGGARPTPNSWVITALLDRADCADTQEMQKRARHPRVVFGQSTVTITFFLRGLETEGRCGGLPPVCTYIRLSQPLGQRRLIDGGSYPPVPVKENERGARCRDGRLFFLRRALRR